MSKFKRHIHLYFSPSTRCISLQRPCHRPLHELSFILAANFVVYTSLRYFVGAKLEWLANKAKQPSTNVSTRCFISVYHPTLHLSVCRRTSRNHFSKYCFPLLKHGLFKHSAYVCQKSVHTKRHISFMCNRYTTSDQQINIRPTV